MMQATTSSDTKTDLELASGGPTNVCPVHSRHAHVRQVYQERTCVYQRCACSHADRNPSAAAVGQKPLETCPAGTPTVPANSSSQQSIVNNEKKATRTRKASCWETSPPASIGPPATGSLPTSRPPINVSRTYVSVTQTSGVQPSESWYVMIPITPVLRLRTHSELKRLPLFSYFSSQVMQQCRKARNNTTNPRCRGADGKGGRGK